jgi:hypothetical protein
MKIEADFMGFSFFFDSDCRNYSPQTKKVSGIFEDHSIDATGVDSHNLFWSILTTF